MRAVVIANGRMEDYEWHRNLILPQDVVICADGGANHAAAMGILPQMVVGDLDSILPQVREELAGKGSRFLPFPRHKDKTDTQLALEQAYALSPQEVLILGGIGPRLDHTLANVSLLVGGLERQVPVRLLDPWNELFVIGSQAEIQGQVGDQVSLLPLTFRVEGVTTEGLKYPLYKGIFQLGNPYGVSNELIASRALVEVEEGWLLAVKAKD